LPADIRPVLESAAAEIERSYSTATDYDRAMAAQSYLLDTQRFTYTFDLPDYGTKEPIEAFLTETPRGSCEQFSTALALILRAWQIPTRLVVGFKQGEFDPTTGIYIFRDKHAHAWVEVYFKELGLVEFDPTPGANDVAESTSGVLGMLRKWAERARGIMMRVHHRLGAEWRGGVIGYSRSQQRRVLEGLSDAAARLAAQASAIFHALWPEMPDFGVAQVVMLVASITFVGMGLHLAGRWLQGKLRRSRRRGRRDRTLRFYQELLRILRKKGMTRPPHVTPREFAQAAGAQLAEANEDGQVVQAALGLVTDMYYRARFGGYELTDVQSARVREALQTLARAKRVGRTRPPAL
ncbi:MAG: transglutaminase domain-containing protein, partial [Candidatus Brocadiae bacterium]|nr:transglutaminase domain-containing protein [Candidatus Brocadiia bacterium]